MAISPGVYTQIIDRSEVPAQEPELLELGAYGLFFIASDKGEDNKIKFINKPKEALGTFGVPNVTKYGLPYLYLMNWLKGGSPAFVCRLTGPDSTYSNCKLAYTVEADELKVESGNIDELKDVESLNVGENMLFHAVGRGEYYDNISLTIVENTKASASNGDFLIYDLTISENDLEGNPIPVEGPFTFSTNPKARDNSGESLFIEDVINTYSKVLRVKFDVSGIVENLNIDGITVDSDFIDGKVTNLYLRNGSAEGIFTNVEAYDRNIFSQLVLDFIDKNKDFGDPSFYSIKDTPFRFLCDSDFTNKIELFEKLDEARPDTFMFISIDASKDSMGGY